MTSYRFFGAVAAVACVIAQPAAAQSVFRTVLLGANENPAVTSPATGAATVTIDGTTLLVSAIFRDLSTPLVDAHIHCCVGPAGNAPVAIGFTGLPLGSTTGSFTGSYDLTLLSTYRATFVTASGGTVDGARTRLLSELTNGNVYFNVHSELNRGGEIRGQLALVPEPVTWMMMILGFGATGQIMRRRRSTLTTWTAA